MSGIRGEKPYVPPEAAIVRIAKAIQESTGGLWDFGEQYAILNQNADFNYQALSRAVKDQYGVDLYPPSVATKLRKAYEKFVVECGIPLDKIKRFSPYYLYELSIVADITKDNVHMWLERATGTPRQDLLAQIKGTPSEKPKEDVTMVRLPESVFQMMQEAKAHLGRSVGVQNMGNATFMEFVSELIMNTQGIQLRRLWDAVHFGPEEDS